MAVVPTWLIGIHEALQTVLFWSHQDTTRLILWFLLWVALVGSGLVLAPVIPQELRISSVHKETSSLQESEQDPLSDHHLVGSGLIRS